MKLRLNCNIENTDKFIDGVIRRYHFEDKDKADIVLVYEQLKKMISPYALYRINQWVSKVKEIDDNQTALVAITLDKAPDILYDRYTSDDNIQEAYMCECISNELLMGLYDEFSRNYGRLHRRYVSGYIFPEEENSLTGIRELLKRLQENEEENIGIKANEYGVMTPSKTVIFYAVLSENPVHACAGICDSCTNAECNYRKKEDNIKLNYGYQRIFSH